MQDIQTIFSRINAVKKERRDLQKIYRDLLDQNKAYQDLLDELNTLKAKKAEFETATKNEMMGEFHKLEEIKGTLKSDQELLSDAAMTMFMKGETVSVTDEHDQVYEPAFAVKFKKTDRVERES